MLRLGARAVGGDSYDFLDLGQHRIALALADVSGKGLPAALLMASVQATLRTRCTASPWDLGAVLREINRFLCESRAPEHFVTLFLGDYDDITPPVPLRQLRAQSSHLAEVCP
jgi:phosphoserine phosphatase RsbU/P